MKKPRPVLAGDVVGVIAPGGAVDAAAVAAGVRVLEGAGFVVRVGRSTYRRHGFYAGRDEDRLRDLAEMLQDPEVRAIVAARGGYGTGRLLPRIDLDPLRADPKVIVGYSDVTFLLLHLLQSVPCVTFHGPMVSDLGADPSAIQSFVAILAGQKSGWNLAARSVVQPGTCEGRLTGGCLSVLVSTLGTPYEIETAGRILFIEDVNEKPYRIDRMLTHLRHAGKLDRVAGVIFGTMRGCTAGEDEAVSAMDVITEAFAGAPYPVAAGLPVGHGGHATLPLGVRARLAGDRLTLLESPFAAATTAGAAAP